MERKSVTIEQEYGTEVITWVTLHSVWAAVEPLSGREYIISQSAQSEVTTRIRMRYLSYPGELSGKAEFALRTLKTMAQGRA